MGRQRRVVAGIAAIVGVVVQMMLPDLPWSIGVPFLMGCAAVAAVALFPENVRALGSRIPHAAPYLDRAITWICVDPDEETITAGNAIRAVMEARPSSIETTEARIRDQAATGKIRSWGKKIPTEAIPMHLPSLEQIETETWLYAQIDLGSIHGPLPDNRMRFLRPHDNITKPLFQAVRFNKKEINALCIAERLRK